MPPAPRRATAPKSGLGFGASSLRVTITGVLVPGTLDVFRVDEVSPPSLAPLGSELVGEVFHLEAADGLLVDGVVQVAIEFGDEQLIGNPVVDPAQLAVVRIADAEIHPLHIDAIDLTNHVIHASYMVSPGDPEADQFGQIALVQPASMPPPDPNSPPEPDPNSPPPPDPNAPLPPDPNSPPEPGPEPIPMPARARRRIPTRTSRDPDRAGGRSPAGRPPAWDLGLQHPAIVTSHEGADPPPSPDSRRSCRRPFKRLACSMLSPVIGSTQGFTMDKNLQQLQEIWDTFLQEWPLERLRRMTLQEYTAAGQGHTFTAWIESRLDKMGSIWGGSAFKFGIFSRKDKTPKPGGGGVSYTQDYAWYTKYGSTPEDAFAKVRSFVVQVAESAARGDFAAIDAVDLGEAYKWKIAFHYQDRKSPGVIAVFKRERLQAWLKGRVGSIPQQTPELHRLILSMRRGEDLMAVSREVWEETAGSSPPTIERTEEAGSGEVIPQPLNLILYGPPGTGKTYVTTKLPVQICDGVLPESREALMARYRELRNLRRIRFVTFHPSFSYEEFVEGIRPSTEDGQVRYDVRPGIFKQAVTYSRELFEKREAPTERLDLRGRRLFKMSLGDTTLREEAWIYPDCLENGYVCLGFAQGIDFAGCNTLQEVRDRYKAEQPDGEEKDYGMTAVNYLKNEIQRGDLILVSDGNTRFRAIAEVTGAYYFQAREVGYEHRRPVRWLWTSTESLPVDTVSSKRLSQMSIYLMDQKTVKWHALQELMSPRRLGAQAPNCVLVIDEINRANLAKTFGELITLLEPSKRLGQPDEQLAELAYSGDLLGVPPNLFVIGTMNTADRSIALMDTALRRRFAFREMAPDVEQLERDVEGIDLQALLTAINTRIEGLFDRDHVLGHTYLMAITSFDELVLRLRNQIIPLLQEYFFDDWRRIQQVFNDIDQPAERQIIQSLDRGVGDQRQRFRVNPVISPAAIQKIYS